MCGVLNALSYVSINFRPLVSGAALFESSMAVPIAIVYQAPARGVQTWHMFDTKSNALVLLDGKRDVMLTSPLRGSSIICSNILFSPHCSSNHPWINYHTLLSQQFALLL